MILVLNLNGAQPRLVFKLRAILMFDGKLVGEKVNKNVTDREIGLLMAGIA